MYKVDKRYEALIAEFSGNTKLQELFDYAIIDLEKQKRLHHAMHGVYPQPISLIDKIIEDFRIYKIKGGMNGR